MSSLNYSINFVNNLYYNIVCATGRNLKNLIALCGNSARVKYIKGSPVVYYAFKNTLCSLLVLLQYVHGSGTAAQGIKRRRRVPEFTFILIHNYIVVIG